MKTVIFNLLALLLLTGCATAFDTVANFYDSQDPCQTGRFSEQERQRLGRPVGYQAPNFCGATQGRTYIYNQQGQRQGYIAK